MIAACGDLFGGGDDDKESSKSSGSSGSGGEDVDCSAPGALCLSSSELDNVYPDSLTMTSFPETVDETPGEPAPGSIALPLNLQESGETDLTQKHPKVAAAEIKKRLDGTASECFASGILRDLKYSSNSIDLCYEFDLGIINGTSLGKGDGGKLKGLSDHLKANNIDYSIDDLKNGMAANDQDNFPNYDPARKAPCMIATSKLLVTSATKKVEAALNLFQGMLCQAKKDNLTFGESGSLDMTQTLTTFKTKDNVQISAATIEVVDKPAEGEPTYKSNVKFTSNIGTEFEVTLVHSPADVDNINYKGVLYFKNSRSSPEGGGKEEEGTSILYEKSGDSFENSRIKYEVRNMLLKDLSKEIFDKNGLINFTGFDQNDNNSTFSNMTYFAFDVNPSNYAGKLSFWKNPGGSYNEAARGFTFESFQNSDGTLKGCAWAGANHDVSIRKSLTKETPLKVTGCFTPNMKNNACGQTSSNTGPNAWKQCFKQLENGKYEIDTAETTESEGYTVLDLTATPSNQQPPFIDLSAVQDNPLKIE